MTLTTVLPYLVTLGIYVLGHFQVGSKLAALIGVPNLIPTYTPPTGTTPAAAAKTPAATVAAIAASHPVLSDAVSAAVKQAASDAAAGHITSLKDELVNVVKAAVAAAVADVKGAPAITTPAAPVTPPAA